jgi:hypothetical protein
MLYTILVVVLILLLIGALPTVALQCGVGLCAWWRARHGPCGRFDSCPIGENIG